jgi:hypothetical protein
MGHYAITEFDWCACRHHISAVKPPYINFNIENVHNTYSNNCKQMKNNKGKGKAVPLQTWNGPEGSRKLRFPDFLTTAQDGGKVVCLTYRPHLPPGNIPGTHFC